MTEYIRLNKGILLVIVKVINSMVICSQVVYLFFIYDRPHILTNELHGIQFIFKPRNVFS